MSDFSTVVRLLEEGVDFVYPTAHLIIVDGGRPVLDERRGGATDGGPIFDVASLTKALVTTTLAMRHLDAGRLRLEDELRAGVTVRHALSHSSGLPAWLPLHQGAADRAAVVERARTTPLVAAPGARSVYSDLGLILLGDHLETIAGGQRLDRQWQEVAAGLGLDDSATFHPLAARTWPTSAALPPGLVHDDNARAMEGVAGHAGLFATAAAVSSLAAHLVARWPDDPTLRAFWTPCGVPGSTWCLGWDRPSPVAGASQAGDRWPRDGVGHLGFTGCSLWIDPPRARWVVLLSNRVYPTGGNDAIKRLRPRLHDAIVAALDG